MGEVVDFNVWQTARRPEQQPTPDNELPRNRKIERQRNRELTERFTGPTVLAADLWAAACRGLAPAFDEQAVWEQDDRFIERYAYAARLCAGCPVMEQCRNKVMSLEEQQRLGIWAGVPYGRAPEELKEVLSATK